MTVLITLACFELSRELIVQIILFAALFNFFQKEFIFTLKCVELVE